MKIATVVGARPQFIKAAVVSRAIADHNASLGSMKITEILVHTGQHYDENMSGVFFEEMMIPHPNYFLGVGGNSHGAMTGRMLEKLEKVFVVENPALVMVYGDTNSTLAGTLAAAKLGIPVAHVEAGLRSFNMKMPEEINRILTDRIATWLFCPTDRAVDHLGSEGFFALPESCKPLIFNVGDVMYDAALFYKSIAQPSNLIADILEKMQEKYYLATIHRAENTNDIGRFANIMNALERISCSIPVILPMHPRTKKVLVENNMSPKNIRVIDPVGYFDMIALLSHCKAVFTDSGGVQKEAFFFNRPCIVFRDETEWSELVDNGFSTLVGADCNKILTAEQAVGKTIPEYKKNLYGKGDAGRKIVQLLMKT